MMNEQQFKSWFRENWDGWLSTYEPRRGGTIGIADLQILVKGRIVPIELKVGEIQGGKLFCHDVRASQVQWHRDLFKAGGYSLFVVGVGENKIPDKILFYQGSKAAMLQNKFDFRPEDEIAVANFSSHLHDILAFRMGCYT